MAFKLMMMPESERPNMTEYDPSMAQYHLTLRYNPLLTSSLPHISPSDMHHLRHLSCAPEVIRDLVVESMHTILDMLPTNACVWVALSGGVDSALMIGLLRRYFPDLNITAMTLRFDGALDETKQAMRIAEFLGVDHTVVDVDNYMLDLPTAIHAVSLPMWDLHWYHALKTASAHSADLLISGDGGDELFGGYTFRYKNFLQEISHYDVHNITPEQKVQAYLNNHIRDFVPDQNLVFGTMMNFSWNNIYRILNPYFDNQLEPLEQVFLADYNGKLLYNFSKVGTLLSNHFDVKTATPLLSNKIIQYAMGINVDQKYNTTNNMGKLPLRSLLRLLGMENLILEYKAGFSPNTASYWHKYGYDICSAYLNSNTTRIIQDGWINGDWIKSNLRRDIKDIRYINKFLGLLAFEVWYRMFITTELDRTTKLC